MFSSTPWAAFPLSLNIATFDSKLAALFKTSCVTDLDYL